MGVLVAERARIDFGDMFANMFERAKTEAFLDMIRQSEIDVANGNFTDGEMFMQEILDGKS